MDLCYSHPMYEDMQVPSPAGRVLGRVARYLLPTALTVALLAVSCSGSIPIPFLQPTPTMTPLPTATPASSPTVTPLPTATPMPVLAADEALEAGLRHQRNGDYGAAIAVYQGVLSSYPQSVEAREALYELGGVYMLDEDYPAAIQTFQDFRDQYPDDERYPFATFRLATAYEKVAWWDEAILAYREYGASRTIIADYVHLFVGYALMELERYEEAREEFAQVLDLTPTITLKQQAQRNLALASRRLEEYDAALGYYQQLMDLAQEDGTRAETLFQIAVTYQEAEEPDQAVEVFTRLAGEYPRTYRAYQAVEELDALEITVLSPFERGLIYYYNGLYDPAVLAFYDHIEDVEDTAEAHYYAALAYRGYDAHYLSVEELETIVQEFPTSDLYGQAWMEMARSWLLLDNDQLALDTYRRFYFSRPQDALADDARWKVANILEDEGEWEQALVEYVDLVETFPASDYAAPSLFRAGLQWYRLGEYDEALQSWEKLLQEYPQSDSRPRTLYWLGKSSLEQGNEEDGLAYLSQLPALDKGAYYGLRASDLLRGSPPDDPPDDPPDVYSPDLYRMGDPEERLELEAWLAGWAGDEGGAPLWDLAPRLRGDSLFQKGMELLNVGQRDSAKARFREVRAAFQDDPLALYQLALFFQREGFYDQSIACAQRLLLLSPEESLYDVPRFLQKLHYPLPFADLIVPAAEKRGLEPLLFSALIWQESWYDPFATSSYPARGLTQFIEPTAEWAAEELGLTDFVHTDLYRPVVAVEFGGWYLQWILEYEDGEVFRALAHYNAGPANVARWRRDGEVNDIDLFVEEVDLTQTETFIHRIYQHYWVYRTAYYGAQ